MSDVIVIYETVTEVIEVDLDPEVVTEIGDSTEVEVIEIIEEGPQGIRGPAGADAVLTEEELDAAVAEYFEENPPPANSFHHYQSSASTTWVIVHNLGFRPAGVYVEDTSHRVVEGVVSHQSVNQLTVTFNKAQSGTADLS